jgi:hypothetical protein
MVINIKEITNGNLDGQIVWICHYNRPDMNKKALRNVPPTKVIVRCNDNLPAGKRIYYSESHFCALNKDDKPTSKVIAPFDNTGYRSYPGNPLFVFDNESDCNAKWQEQLNAHIEVLDELISSAGKHWQDEKIKLETLF